jgi:hypothetical protein
MSSSGIFAGVICEKCFQPILVYSDVSWKKIVAFPVSAQAASGVTCSHSGCSHRAEYPTKEFMRFRVEEIPAE